MATTGYLQILCKETPGDKPCMKIHGTLDACTTCVWYDKRLHAYEESLSTTASYDFDPNDFNETCPNCGGFKAVPTFWGGTAKPRMCDCPKLPVGWVCPKCGSVWSPNVKECENCNNT